MIAKYFHMVIEQTKKYPMRMIYRPDTGGFIAGEHESLAHARNFTKPYGWIKESGTPPKPHWDCGAPQAISAHRGRRRLVRQRRSLSLYEESQV